MEQQTTAAAGNIGKDFILAGRAVFTVVNPKGERYTFKVSKKENEDGRKPVYFVALLTGPNNEADYTYLGMLSPAVGTVILTKASKFKTDSTPVKVAQYFVALIWRGQAIPDGYGVHHEGHCGRCGRALTVPSSILTGLGPDCAAIMGLGPVAPVPQPVLNLGAEWQEETEANTNAENEGGQ